MYRSEDSQQLAFQDFYVPFGILSIWVDGHPFGNFSKLLTPQRGARL